MSVVECWASPLQDCCETQSREHIVSKSLFDDMIEISGLPWCKDQPKVIGINSLVRKCLCAHHNSTLSPLDAEAKRFRELIRWANSVGKRIASGAKPHPLVRRRKLNGRLFERWLLKTAINILSQTPYNHGSPDTQKPSLEDIDICFGKKPWPPKRGMYFASKLGEKLSTKEVFDFMPIVDSSKSACGWIVSFCGFRFYLSIRNDPFTTEANKLWGLSDELDDLGLNYHTENIEFAHGKRTHSVIHFDWN